MAAQLLSRRGGANTIRYWQKQLAAMPPSTYPPTLSVSTTGSQRRNHTFSLDETLSAQLRALAKDSGTTLYTVSLAALYVLLSKYSGQLSDEHDIIIGTPTDNRHHVQTQALLGMFVNTLPFACTGKATLYKS